MKVPYRRESDGRVCYHRSYNHKQLELAKQLAYIAGQEGKPLSAIMDIEECEYGSCKDCPKTKFQCPLKAPY